MDDVQKALHAAWERIRPMLLRNPDELRRRIARRRSRLIESPPRAWCLAVRASDTRLGGYCVTHPERFKPLQPHEVILDSRALERLCAPVFITAPGQPLREVAALLGVRPTGLLDARLNGVFQTHYVTGLGGNFGKPCPLLYTRRPLDPSARSFACADPIWSATARHAPGRIPASIKQILTRVPLYQPAHLDRDRDELHPENFLGSERRESKRLAAPAKDHVWYKWTDDHYVGHDPRNPLARLNAEQRERRLASIRARMRKRRRENPAPSRTRGSLKFRGWRWRCPRCGRLVNMLYLPLPRLALIDFTKLSAISSQLLARRNKGNRQLATRASFACDKCHRVRRFSRCDPNAWNELVTYLSAGLLFGHEVTRPEWWTPERRRGYTPRPNREPSKRRMEIEQRLLAGEPFRAIAESLGIAYGTVLWYARGVYKQHGVRSLPDLLRKQGIAPKPKKREEVRRRLTRGEPIAQIAREMGISSMCVYNHVYMLRRAGTVARDRDSAETRGAAHRRR